MKNSMELIAAVNMVLDAWLCSSEHDMTSESAIAENALKWLLNNHAKELEEWLGNSETAKAATLAAQ